jgi:hypothetical protein
VKTASLSIVLPARKREIEKNSGIGYNTFRKGKMTPERSLHKPMKKRFLSVIKPCRLDGPAGFLMVSG